MIQVIETLDLLVGVQILPAEAGAVALIQYLKNQQETAAVSRVSTDNITAGAWLEKFTNIETSPRTARNAAKNRPYSLPIRSN